MLVSFFPFMKGENITPLSLNSGIHLRLYLSPYIIPFCISLPQYGHFSPIIYSFLYLFYADCIKCFPRVFSFFYFNHLAIYSIPFKNNIKSAICTCCLIYPYTHTIICITSYLRTNTCSVKGSSPP